MSTTINHTQIAPSTDYKLWSGADSIQWIISINASKFDKYREPLTQAFNESNFRGSDITELDNADLQKYGIINRDDRNTIHKTMQQLIVAQKRRDSQILEQPADDTQDQDPEIIISPRLSDDEENEMKRDYSHGVMPGHATQSSVSDIEEEKKSAFDHSRILLPREQFLAQFYGDKGFTEWIPDQRYDQTVHLLIMGFIRGDYNQPKDYNVSTIIITYYTINTKSFGNYVEIQSGQRWYFTLMANISLSKILASRADKLPLNRIIIELEEVKTETLEHILEYLGHHKGREPDELLFASGNAMELNQTVKDGDDSWDAQWIGAFDINTVLMIVEAAERLGLRHLKHLANNARIALLFGAFGFQS